METKHALTTLCVNGKTGYGVATIYAPDFICKETAERLCALTDEGFSLNCGIPWRDVEGRLKEEGFDVSCHPLFWEHEEIRTDEDEVTEKIITEVLKELRRAKSLHPAFPVDPLHGVAVVAEELGELTRATLQDRYEPEKTTPEEIRAEALQTAAMALRFLANFERMDFSTKAQTAPGPRQAP